MPTRRNCDRENLEHHERTPDLNTPADPKVPLPEFGEATLAIENRSSPNFSISHRALRAVFGLVWFVFASWTPPPMGAWRRFLLRLFGAKIHPTATVRGGARIWYPPNLEMKAFAVLADGVQCYNMGTIVIGENSIVSQRSFLCGGTHDYKLARHPLVTAPIVIGDDVWIAAEAFVAPGVTVPDGCVIGARAVVSGKLEPWTIYAGNPARILRSRDYDANGPVAL
jgi:putative colanic acid biosynthesis acetyltransferase WcaF